MSRDIKFRAWHKQDKKMYQVYTFYFTGNKQIELHGKGVTQAFTIGEDIELMQYTGIKDKNGQEIYEGDIVRYDAFDIQGVVTWVANGPGFTILRPNKTGACVLHSEWQVIGNIYEHSHLILVEADN
jgi:hypothetical protein